MVFKFGCSWGASSGVIRVSAVQPSKADFSKVSTLERFTFVKLVQP